MKRKRFTEELDKNLLPDSLEAAESILSGNIQPAIFIDPWGRPLKKYSFNRFNIQTW